MKLIIVLAIISILVALAAAGRYMLRRDGKSRADSMARALAWRVGLSVLLFLFILLSYKLGWIVPTGLPLGR